MLRFCKNEWFSCRCVPWVKKGHVCPVLCIVDPVGYSVMNSGLYVSNDRSGF